MKVEGTTVVLKSNEQWYELERSGVKPNTLRIIDGDEWAAIVMCENIRVERTGDAGDTCFTRKIGWMGVIDAVLGKLLVMICWRS
jgi:hypothetical protein